jgi:YbbR domain-containing protein
MWLFRNPLYKLIALLVAVVLWASVQGIRSVEQSLDVPISLEDTPPDVVVVDLSATDINVRIVGSRAAVRRAERQLTRYPLSLRGLKPGEARLAVEADLLSPPRGARVTARSPSLVTVRLDHRVKKRVHVRADLVGEPPGGFRLVGVDVVPQEVVLEGARTALRNLREVLTERIELGTLRGPTEEEVRLALGSAHIWRADGEGLIRVQIRVEPLASPDGDSSSDAVRGRRGEGPV